MEEPPRHGGASSSTNVGRSTATRPVLVSIELRSQTEDVLNEFEEAVVRCPSMSLCSFVSGDTDFVMMVHVRSFGDYDRVYRSKLSKLPDGAQIRSDRIALSRICRRTLDPGVRNVHRPARLPHPTRHGRAGIRFPATP